MCWCFPTKQRLFMKCHQISITVHLKTTSLKDTEKLHSLPKPELIKKQESSQNWPGWLPRIVGNAENSRKDRKFHKSDQTLNQTKTNINKLCLGKVSLQKTVRIKFSIDSRFLNNAKEIAKKITKSYHRHVLLFQV